MLNRWVMSILVTGVFASVAQASMFRLYLSETGTDDGTTAGSALMPSQAADPTDLAPGSHRLWVWGSPIGANTSVNGLNFDVKVDGDLNIDGYNFWNHFLQVVNRWDGGAFPGAGGDSGQLLSGLSFTANATPGITNNPFSGFDTHYDSSTNSTVFGYIDVSGSIGDVNIVFQSGSIAAPDTYDTTFLGLDDAAGNAGAGFYDNASPEANFLPEPGGVSLLVLGSAALLRRRKRRESRDN